jgi:hypothetical protein
LLSLHLDDLHQRIAELLEELLLMLVWWLWICARVLIATGGDACPLWTAADAPSAIPQQWLPAAHSRAD